MGRHADIFKRGVYFDVANFPLYLLLLYAAKPGLAVYFEHRVMSTMHLITDDERFILVLRLLSHGYFIRYGEADDCRSTSRLCFIMPIRGKPGQDEPIFGRQYASPRRARAAVDFRFRHSRDGALRDLARSRRAPFSREVNTFSIASTRCYDAHFKLSLTFITGFDYDGC